MKLKGILKAIKIGLGVSKSLVTGKVAKVLDTASDAVEIAVAVKATIDKAKTDHKKK